MSRKIIKKSVIIITDGTDQIQKIASLISQSLTGYKVKVFSAEKFQGNDLLPSDIFIIGCEYPNPASFGYLEELLLHINLVSRKCGIYSVKEKTLKYLSKIVKDCEAKLYDPLLAEDGNIEKTKISNWIKNFV